MGLRLAIFFVACFWSNVSFLFDIGGIGFENELVLACFFYLCFRAKYGIMHLHYVYNNDIHNNDN